MPHVYPAENVPVADTPAMPPSRYDAQCIIQWHADGKHRKQANFQSLNTGSHRLLLTGEKKRDRFDPVSPVSEEFHDMNRHSYSIHPQMAHRIALGTTDVFLYGHSTYRNLEGQAEVEDELKLTRRGISVDGRYVSAKELALYVDSITNGDLKLRLAGGSYKIRIWLFNCYSAGTGLTHNFAERFAQRLCRLGWNNTQIIGFRTPVTKEYLRICRELAGDTNLFENAIRFQDLLLRRTKKKRTVKRSSLIFTIL